MVAISTRIPTRTGDGEPAQTSTGDKKSQILGLVCVVFTALGWGINWPATKFLLTECPPLSARGVAGLVAGLVLFGVALSLGETLYVPRHLRGRLVAASLLNVSAWMGLTTASLLWLPAGQAVTLAYTMPIWATLLSWPMLGERPGPRQIAAIILESVRERSFGIAQFS
jgi:drug/metabolite transporter (DMT)-like permease